MPVWIVHFFRHLSTQFPLASCSRTFSFRPIM